MATQYQQKKWTAQALKNYREYQKEFAKQTYKQYNIRFHKDDDAVIIDRISEQENATDYIRDLILKDIGKENTKIKKPNPRTGETGFKRK